MKILKAIISVCQRLLGIINILLIVVIVLNLLNLILGQVQKEGYISFLGYSYVNVVEDNKELDLKNGDFASIDLNKLPEEGKIAFYQEDTEFSLGKVSKIKEDNIIINNEKETIVKKNLVVGTVINIIPVLGKVVTYLFKPMILIIAIITIIITSIIQKLIQKKLNKMQKPDFKKYNNPV